jgi:hypothetical protein
MNNSTIRALRVAATIVGVSALGATFAGTAFATDQGDAITHSSPHSFEMPTSVPVRDDYAPGSDSDSDINHNYHDDLRPNSDSNTNSNSSFAQCGSGYDDTASRDDCSEKNTYDHRYDHDYSYDGDPDSKGDSVLGSLF